MSYPIKQRMENYVYGRIKDIEDLNNNEGLMCCIFQNGVCYKADAITVDENDPQIFQAHFPKETMMQIDCGPAEIQFSYLDNNFVLRSHKPKRIVIGKVLKEDGYGD